MRAAPSSSQRLAADLRDRSTLGDHGPAGSMESEAELAGVDATEAFHGDSPYRPRTPCNASKAGGDHAVRSYFETFGLPVTITNCADNYGPNQLPGNVLPQSREQVVPDRPGHDRRYLLDSRVIGRELGRRPEIRPRAGLAPGDRLRGRCPGHHPLVRGQPRVVGAVADAQPGRRERMDYRAVSAA
ncbi:GDP-mannose 4,6-dehydratase [Lentzea chajnantorensis]